MKKITNSFSALSLDSEDPKDDEVSAGLCVPSENSSENGKKMTKKEKKKKKASMSRSDTIEAKNTNSQSEKKAPCNSHNMPLVLIDLEMTEKKQQKESMSRSNTMEAKNTDSQSEQKATCNSLSMPLVWIDLEMTGLNVEEDRILEIACIITDGKLVKKVEGPDLIIHQSEECLGRMGEWCQNHHSANGLVEAVLKSKVSEQEAELQVLEFVKKYTGPSAPLLAGNSVYVDFMFLKKYMPNLAAIFSHVVVDVSSIKALCFRWYPNDAKKAPSKKNSHRALDDIKESIAELQYLQKTIFKASQR